MRQPIVATVLMMSALVALPATAQQSVRDSALTLYDKGNHLLALPLLEKAASANPNDLPVLESLGFALLESSGALPDTVARRAQRARAREILARAVQSGSKNLVIAAIVDAMPVDGGSDAVFSSNREVDAAMQKAEAAYSAQDYRTAFTKYQEALALDPTQYDAALFSGDVYLHLNLPDSAYFWYNRATQINPYRETAYRYWSDVLTKNSRIDEGRDKAIEAVVAEPYNRVSLQGLQQWAPVAKVPVGYPLVAFPNARDTTLMHSAAGLAYDSVRKAWKGTDAKGGAEFVKQFPNEKTYRHSMFEEKAALLAALKAGAGNPIFNNVKLLDDAGMLESFVLFVRPDAGIAKDYPDYASANREKLKKFWADFVIGAKFIK